MSEKCCDTRCPISTSLGLLVLRLVAGAFLATHGWAKFHDPSMKSMFFDSVHKMNLPAPNILAWAAIAAELLGGVLLALGFLTRVWAFLILCVMGVAIAKVHLHEGLPAMEMAALYGGIAFAFLLGGPGRISVDGMLFCKGKKSEDLTPEEPVEKF
jgi:putative oxidoreductase